MRPDYWPKPPYRVYGPSFTETGPISGHVHLQEAHFSNAATKEEALATFADLTDLGTDASNEHIVDAEGVTVFSAEDATDIKYIQDNFKP